MKGNQGQVRREERRGTKKEGKKRAFSPVLFTTLTLSLMTSFSCIRLEPCSDEFLESYSTMQDHFDQLYTPTSGEAEVESLRLSLKSFLEKHSGVQCQGPSEKSYDVTEEVTSFYNSLIAENQKNISPRQIRKAIYGRDDRMEVADAPELYQSWAASTAALIRYDSWDKDFKLKTQTLGALKKLCPDERFYDQLSAAVCSGFLVGPDLLVTAGHCVHSLSDCANFSWVFDFKDGATSLQEKNIYSCEKIVAQNFTSLLDYAVIRLDRKVEGRKFFRVRTSGTVSVGTPLVVIGHPSGISTKIADGGKVLESSEKNYFSADTDTFGGNSGSPMINRSNGVVEGILVYGASDYEDVTLEDGTQCTRATTCTSLTCDGEQATKMAIVPGISLIGDYDKVVLGLYEDKSYPEITERKSLPISFLGYSYENYTLGGIKFLDHCGAHFYKSEDPTTWLDSFVGSCDEEGLRDVISHFSSLFYF